MLRFDRKQQNYVKQLSFNKKIKKKRATMKFPLNYLFLRFLKSIATDLQKGNFGFSIF